MKNKGQTFDPEYDSGVILMSFTHFWRKNALKFAYVQFLLYLCARICVYMPVRVVRGV